MSQDGLLTLDREYVQMRYIQSLDPPHHITERIEKDSMSIKRTWDETMSPQWRYLHQQESARKRGGRKTAARLRREEEEKNTTTSETKYEKINSELKREKVKYDIKSTRLSTESKKQE